MAATYLNQIFPHTASIERPDVSATPPYTVTLLPLWAGAVDCQVGTGGRTAVSEGVMVSDYVVYAPCIEVELMTGDRVTVIRQAGHTPIVCTIEQHTTDRIWQQDGIEFGTTLWVNEVKG
jgi:hypothetical protein